MTDLRLDRRFAAALTPLTAQQRADLVGTLGSAMHEGLDPDDDFVATMVALRRGECGRDDLLAKWRRGS
ncbi:hypothetical protein [Gordonia sp. (in: high G+C Gram-positive bacteria)]|jgi:hypothetical protein|uniref:hypothetical protein n=1 Tax=Gordonia sp. (in: high G+C Gram-positive bacteria) TaxID=84139 RepID=UPI001DD83553|nr:hypothetical protein [Gordonia sp. (in: high G+C Gram-positive bacteria)]MCB1293472.1 hypothetical protein [Gordonia sp. (in: high G+C Gram-positive bacteria)]HMS75118.1 hypothetical protein [Gordonia sp. (in: high G+C Gram-positive bacteria)]